MMIPSVHLNGTGKASLLAELEEAHNALLVADQKLRQVTVHGRDYYVQGANAYGQAREEMDRRLAALDQLMKDVREMHAGIQSQGR